MNIKPNDVVAAFRQLRAERAFIANGCRVHIYFDTWDVSQIILGARGYYSRANRYLAAEFESNHALVWSLVATESVAPIRMLAPHQAELLTLIQYGFHHHTALSDEQVLRRFHDNAEPPGGGKEVPFPQRIVIATKALAAAWLPWKRRLSSFVNRKTVDLDTSRQDYTQLVQSAMFHDLYDLFAKHREHRPVNNFADAATLVSLITAADDVRSGASMELPIFYASSPLFDSILREAGYRNRLVLDFEDVTFDVLCSAEYLILRAVFAEDKDGIVPLDDNEMMNVLAEGPFGADVHALEAAGDYWSTIQKMFGYRLYQRVWLPAFQRLRALTEESKFSDLEGVQREVEDRVVALTTQLRKNTNVFRRLRDLWIELSQALNYFLKRKLPLEPLLIDGLLRFSFPPAVQASIKEELKRLQSGDRFVIDGVASMIVRALDHGQLKWNEIATIAGLFWVLRCDERLLTFLNQRNATGHHSLLVLQAAAQLRSHSELSTTKLIVDRLNEEYHLVADSLKRAELAIGIAYLDFRLAKAMGFVPSWQLDDSATVGEEGRQYIIEAIDRARVAAAHTGLDPSRRAYATNQYLYYLVADSTADESVLRQAATRLTQFQYDANTWQPRFDDTIARYFHLRSHREASPQTKKQLLAWALSAATDASDDDPDDDHDIKTFHTQMKIEYDAYRSAPDILLGEDFGSA
jgi:hypothetical protein